MTCIFQERRERKLWILVLILLQKEIHISVTRVTGNLTGVLVLII